MAGRYWDGAPIQFLFPENLRHPDMRHGWHKTHAGVMRKTGRTSLQVVQIRADAHTPDQLIRGAPGRIRTCDARFRNEARPVVASPPSAVSAGQLAVRVQRVAPIPRRALERMGKRMGKPRCPLRPCAGGLSTPDVPDCAFLGVQRAVGWSCPASVDTLSTKPGNSKPNTKSFCVRVRCG